MIGVNVRITMSLDVITVITLLNSQKAIYTRKPLPLEAVIAFCAMNSNIPVKSREMHKYASAKKMIIIVHGCKPESPTIPVGLEISGEYSYLVLRC
jgi:hypothetical protein